MFGGYIELNRCGAELHQEAEECMQSLAKIIAHGQRQGVFRPGNALIQTLAAMSMLQGLSMLVSTSGLLKHMAQEPNKLRGVALQMFYALMTGLKKNN
jgi:hypothetical protein